MAKRVLCLFDVDGTLTDPRKVLGCWGGLPTAYSCLVHGRGLHHSLALAAHVGADGCWCMLMGAGDGPQSLAPDRWWSLKWWKSGAACARWSASAR